MYKNLFFTSFLIFIFNLAVQGQVSLVFPKNDYVFDSSNIVFEWNNYLDATSYHFQIAVDSNFDVIILDETNLISANYYSNNLPVNQKLYWRCKADNSLWSEIRTFRIIDFSTFSQLEMWLKADSVEIETGDRISVWYDYSGNGHDFLQTNSANQPYLLSDNQEIDNHNMVEFRSSGFNYFNPLDFSFLSEGEIFSIIKLKNSPPNQASSSGLWTFGTSSLSDHYPYIDNITYMGFGRDTRLTIGNILGVNLTNAHLLNINSSATFKLRINQNELFSSTSGVSSFNDNVYLGQSLFGHYLDGSISEIMLFNIELTDSLRDLVHSYLFYKYAPPVNLGQNISYSPCEKELHAGTRFTSYQWSTGETTESITVTESGTYWVDVVDIFGFTSSDTIVVTFPEVGSPSIPKFCPSSSKIWNPNLGEHYAYLWSTGETTESIDIDTPGDYWVEITDTNGCVYLSETLTFSEDTFADDVSLGPDRDLCVGNRLELAAGFEEVASYLWNNGTTESFVIIDGPGLYQVELTNLNGCEAETSVNIDVIGESPQVVIGMESTYCKDEVFEFEDVSLPPSDGSSIISWEWDFGDGVISNDESGTHSYQNPGFYEVRLEVETSNGCINFTRKTVEVKNLPQISMVVTNNCQGQQINFDGQQSSPLIISSWEWSFGDPDNNTALGQSNAYSYENPGTYQVSLAATDINGCTRIISEPVSIVPTPQVSFNFNEVCAGGIVNFANTSTIELPATIVSYNWNFGDGTFSTQINPSKPYLVHGDFNVSLSATANNGCINSASHSLKIHAIPINDFTIEQNCAGIPTLFNDNTFIPNGSVAQVNWNFGDGGEDVGFTVGHNYTEPDSYNVSHTARSAFGCQQTITRAVTINDLIKADFQLNPLSIIADYPTTFVNNSIGASNSQWEIGSDISTTVTSPQYTFGNNLVGEEIPVSLEVSNEFGCIDNVTRDFTVLRNHTDLAIGQVFYQEINGFYTVGVQLQNKGTTPITAAELYLRSANTSVVRENWNGVLLAGQSVNYIFNVQLPVTVEMSKQNDNFICVEGQLISPFGFTDVDLSNNERCLAISKEEPIILTPYPNPTKDNITIKVVLPESALSTVEVYDQLGRRVTILANNEQLNSGLNLFNVDLANWNAGLYTVQLNSAIGKKTAKFSVIK